MTLSRQLYALVLIISLLMGIGTLFISIHNTRSYLMLQLATQTQDAANSLGLSLVPYMKDRDIAAMDTMVNAVFDSGYYKSLSLKSMSGDSLIERQNTNIIEGVPQWFINSLELETPNATSIITTGWTQAGVLNLVANPGFAYLKLWDAGKEILWWSLLVFMISLTLAFLILREILKPLNAVEKQALEIFDREFPVVKEIPKTRELKRVVLAMNKMSEKVEGIISRLTERAEQVHRQDHRDEMTGLMNRRAFLALVDNTIRDTEKGGNGYLAIIRLSQLASYNREHGHPAGDVLLQKASNLFGELCETFSGSSVGRIGGMDFAVILPLADAETANKFGQSLSASLDTLGKELKLEHIAHIGIAYFEHNSSFGEIMADADVALASAEHQGVHTYHIQRTKSEAMGNMAWKQLIQETLEKKAIHFMSQPVMTTEAEPIFSELLIRIKDSAGQSVSPASFAAMADRMDLHHQLDQYVIEQATRMLEKESASANALAVKISARSITEVGFSFWLDRYLREHTQAASILYFEITEYGAIQDIEATRSFVDLVHQHHGKVIMEHFGTRSDSFHTLRQLKVDFIKLDGSYVLGIDKNTEHRTFLQTVVDMAQSLDMQIIIEHIETEEDMQVFKTFGLDAMQGFYFGKPKAID